MLIFGDPIIDWSAIWKIVVVALIGGSGVVVVYGFLLLGLKYATTADASGTQTERSKLIGYTLAVICGLAVIAVIVLGVYAMTKKS
jgi:nitrate reductase NapE component